MGQLVTMIRRLLRLTVNCHWRLIGLDDRRKKASRREKDILDHTSMRPMRNWRQYFAIWLSESWIIWIV